VRNIEAGDKNASYRAPAIELVMRRDRHSRDDAIDNAGNRWIHVRIAAIAHPLRIASIEHESCRHEHAHVTRHARLRCLEPVHQFAHR
jgi:hypothetical protein